MGRGYLHWQNTEIKSLSLDVAEVIDKRIPTASQSEGHHSRSSTTMNPSSLGYVYAISKHITQCTMIYLQIEHISNGSVRDRGFCL